MRDLAILTWTAIAMWARCHMEWYFRHVLEIVKKEEARPLRFGSLIHEGLHVLRKGKPLEEAYAHVESLVSQLGCDREDYLKAKAILKAYLRTYGDESEKVVRSEAKFESAIFNVETGHESRTFLRAGKIDAITRENDGWLWLRETKTTSTLGEGYLQRLFLDGQISYYILGAWNAWGVDLKGVIYDIILKSRITQRKEETEAEFEARRADLMAKNKNGKTTATRRLGETEAEFEARLDEQYLDPKMFHREVVMIPHDKLALLEREVYSITAEIRQSKKTEIFRRNTDACFRWNKPCQYFPICAAGENKEAIIDAMYDHKPANSELLEEEKEIE